MEEGKDPLCTKKYLRYDNHLRKVLIKLMRAIDE